MLSFTFKWKLVFIWKDEHQDSLEKEAKGNLEMAYYYEHQLLPIALITIICMIIFLSPSSLSTTLESCPDITESKQTRLQELGNVSLHLLCEFHNYFYLLMMRNMDEVFYDGIPVNSLYSWKIENERAMYWHRRFRLFLKSQIFFCLVFWRMHVYMNKFY